MAARTIARSSSVWWSSIKIDKGSSDGIELDQPVVAASEDEDARISGGLIGKVTSVTGGTAEVTLITDASIGIGAQVMPAGAAGVVRPEVGDPRDLLLDLVHGGPGHRELDRRHLRLQDRGARSRCSPAASRSGACPTSTSTRSRSTSACT